MVEHPRAKSSVRPSTEEWARIIAGLFALYGAYYIIWRAGWTLNLDAPWLALPLLTAETLAYVDFLLLFFMTWSVPRPAVRDVPQGLKVDVYITTFDEQLDLLRSTILGAVHMRYPHETYVLDDGRRAEVRALTESLGARYIARKDFLHAKAGNINHALSVTDGDFIATFDADHVPHPQFLERTLGRFSDDRVALVQTPQEFYNVDSIQHAGSAPLGDETRWHEQSMFYRVIQPGKERLNSVFWCGSNAVLRRSAIESIGGIATETITEDIHTTIKLHKAGWRTAYHNELLATGIAPDDLDAFLTQRKRWAQGSMQILRSGDNPIWTSGLTVAQRLSYWASMSTYFASFQKLVLIGTPLAVLVTGILPMNAFGWNFAAHFIPYFVLGLWANSLLSRGYARYLDTERFNFLKAFSFVRASATLVIAKPLKFSVTRKSQVDDRARELRLTMPYVLVIVASVGAIGWAIRAELLGASSSSMRLALALAALWAIYNAGLVAIAIHTVLRRSHRRNAYRFDLRVPVDIQVIGRARQWQATDTGDLNPDGLSFLADDDLPIGQQVNVRLHFGSESIVRATAVVVNSRAAEERPHRIGARFVEISDHDRNELTLRLFGGQLPSGGEQAIPRAA